MKKSIRLFAFIALATLTAVGCKYEEGPKLTLLSKKARISRQWKPSKYVFSSGTETTASDDGSYIEFSKNGAYKYHYGPTNTDLTSTWEFNSDKSGIKVTSTILGISQTVELTILKLTSKELGTKDSSGDKIYYTAM